MSFLHHRFLRHRQKSLFTKGINPFPMNNNFKNKTLLEKLQLTKITFKELFQDFNEITVTDDIHTIDYEKNLLSIIIYQYNPDSTPSSIIYDSLHNNKYRLQLIAIKRDNESKQNDENIKDDIIYVRHDSPFINYWKCKKNVVSKETLSPFQNLPTSFGEM